MSDSNDLSRAKDSPRCIQSWDDLEAQACDRYGVKVIDELLLLRNGVLTGTVALERLDAFLEQRSILKQDGGLRLAFIRLMKEEKEASKKDQLKGGLPALIQWVRMLARRNKK